MRVLREIGGKFSIGGELLAFLWRAKMYWALPLVFVLLVFGLVIVIGSSTGVGPFVYTLF